ncbi:MAG: carboxypeptidase-like regulatory domain-containing protein, partial [Fidelibacterota bacterium]
MLKKLGLFGLSLFCVTSTALAVNYGKIRGNVTDAETGDPLIGANVVVEGTNLGAATDANGEYIILQVSPGQYTVSANVIGYTQVRITEVLVERDHTSQIEFALTQSAVVGEAITVVAQRDVIKLDLAASQTNATRDEITHMPFSTDLESFLDLQAGVDGWEIRGGGADQIGFAVDGLNMVDNAFNQPINMVNMSFIEEVSIIKGGFNAEYGNIRSGMIDVTTEEGTQEFHGSFSYRYSPPHLKHTGYKVTDPRSWYHRPFLDPDVRENGTGGEMFEDEYGSRSTYAAHFGERNVEGWTAETSFSNWEQAMYAYVWEHCIDGYEKWGIPDAADLRKEAGLKGRAVDPLEYGHLPDLDLEFSLSGPVPVIGRYLGDMTFILSVRENKESYVFPAIRDYYQVQNINAKVTSYLGVATKLNLEFLRQNEQSIASEEEDEAWAQLLGPENWYDPYVYTFTPGEAYRTGYGIGIDRTINNRSFWQLRISGVTAEILAGDSSSFTYRNPDTVAYFEHYAVDERP